MARLTPAERLEAVRIAKEAIAEADRIGRDPQNSDFSIHPYGSLDMVDLLSRALLDDIEADAKGER